MKKWLFFQFAADSEVKRGPEKGPKMSPKTRTCAFFANFARGAKNAIFRAFFDIFGVRKLAPGSIQKSSIFDNRQKYDFVMKIIKIMIFLKNRDFYEFFQKFVKIRDFHENYRE